MLPDEDEKPVFEGMDESSITEERKEKTEQGATEHVQKLKNTVPRVAEHAVHTRRGAPRRIRRTASLFSR